MMKALQPACHRTRARLIGSEVESCFRTGNQRQEEPPSAERLSLSAGTKATKAVRWSAAEGGAHRPAPGPEPLGVADPSSGIWRANTVCHLCCSEVSKRFGGGQSSPGPQKVFRKPPLQREKALRGRRAEHEGAQWQWPPTTPDLTQRWTTRGQCPAKESILLLLGLVFTHGKDLL